MTLVLAVFGIWGWRGDERAAAHGAAAAPTIYGADDMSQYYEATGGAAAALFDADVVLVSASSGYLQASGNGYAIVNVPTLAEYMADRYGYPLCAGERFGTEPTLGFCSGFMVGPDLIATAGHCMRQRSDCVDTRFVFGYRVPDATTGPVTWVPAEDVYRCRKIVASAETFAESWALVQTDRPISGHAAVPLRREGRVELGIPVVVAGHPMGLPAKFAADASVGAGRLATAPGTPSPRTRSR